MICPKCNQSNQEGSIFCIKCGNSLLVEQKSVINPMEVKVENKVEPISVPVSTQAQPPVTTNQGLNKTQKIIIVALLLLLVGILLFIIFNKGNNSSNNKKVHKDPTRTIMIYLAGSNLESDSRIVTAELNAIDPSTIDLNSVNILLYTGGTKKWHNFIKNDENAIYKLEADGFKKLEAYPKDSMGNPDNLSKFLEYSYNNYPAGHYNLMFYDHGGAIDGAIYDDFVNDNLSLSDLDMALSNSPFNKTKLDSVIFRTCLNGTLEVSKMFNKYAEYITFSEEVTVGGPFTNVLGYFLNGISPDKEGNELGKDFIDAYKKQLEDLRMKDYDNTTYSVIDLSKIDNVIDKLNSFISSVDIDNNYNEIAKIRTQVYQYGSDDPSYDTVDLYNLVNKLAPYASQSPDEINKALEEAIIYNFSSIEESHGMSIYFPYKGVKKAREYFMGIYNKLNTLNEYKSFINRFEGVRNGNSSYNFSSKGLNLTNEFTPTTDDVVLKLTDEQLEHYNGVIYNIFRRDPDHPNFYQFIYSSNDVDILDNGYIKTKFDGNLIKMTDGTNSMYMFNSTRRNGDDVTTTTSSVLYDKTKEPLSVGYMAAANIKIVNKDNKPTLTTVKLISRDDRVASVVYNINDFNYMEYLKSTYKLFDNNNQFIKYDDWEKSPEMTGIGTELDKLTLEYTGLEDGEYYIYFNVFDENYNYTASDLMRIGE